MPTFLKYFFQLFGKIAPKLSAQLLIRLMARPRAHKLRPFESEVLDRARAWRHPYQGGEIQGYIWGEGGNKVALLAHGWEGHAGNFGALVEMLLEKGYQVIAYDAPSHGKSSRMRTHMLSYGAFLADRLRHHKPDVLLSHSFGSVASVMAIHEHPDLAPKQWFLLTTPSDFKEYVDGIQNSLNLPERSLKEVVHLIEKNSQLPLSRMNMENFGPSAEVVDHIHIIHPITDRIIPIESARRAQKALPGARITEVEGVGHYRILWSDQVKDILRKEVA